MRVFVSWSGEASHHVAKALKEWLPNVIQAVDVFLSSEDIAKGSRWFHELSSVLDSHYLVRDRDDLPFLMRELAGSSPNVRIHTDQDWTDYDDLSEKLKRYKDKWFGR
jgi:hypothetical protein